MQQRLSFITIGVKDLKAIKTFYKDVFGWNTMGENEGVLFYKLNGFILGFYPIDELAKDIGTDQKGEGFKQMSLSINFNSEEEIDVAFNKLCAKGAKSITKPEKVFWGGYRGYIADIENNYWELAYNPFIKMDDAGNILGEAP